MTATLMQLRRLVRARLGIPVSDDFMTDAVLDDHINLAIDTIDSEYHWPWSEQLTTVTITPDAPDIICPPEWRATRALISGDMELSAIAPADLLSWISQRGTPPRVWCSLDDNHIAVRPIVSQSTDLLHYWYRQPTWLRADNDVPSIPAQFSGAIVAKASELLSARESDRASGAVHGSEYTTWLARMRRDVRRSTAPTRPRVRPGGWI